jgi:hypothetical protein
MLRRVAMHFCGANWQLILRLDAGTASGLRNKPPWRLRRLGLVDVAPPPRGRPRAVPALLGFFKLHFTLLSAVVHDRID